MIKHIKFVSIPVANQNRALDFYTDKLGFTIITDQPFDEKQRWIELRIPKAETRVVLFTPEGEGKRIGSFMNMSYVCDDIDKTYAELQKRGVEFEGPPQTQPWGRYAMFKDSEGNRFVLSSDGKSNGALQRRAAADTNAVVRATRFEFEKRFWIICTTYFVGFLLSVFDRVSFIAALRHLIAPSVIPGSSEAEAFARIVI